MAKQTFSDAEVIAADPAPAAKQTFSDAEVLGAPQQPAAKPVSQTLGFLKGLTEPASRLASRFENDPNLRPWLDALDAAVPGVDAARAFIKGPVNQDYIPSIHKAEQTHTPGKTGEFGGNMALGVAAAPAGLIGSGLITGAALSNAPEGDTEGLLKDAVKGGIESKVGGEVFSKAVGGLGAAGKALAGKAAPNYDKVVEAAKAAKNAAYDRIKQLGVSYTPQALTRLVGDVKGAMSTAGAQPGRHSDAFSAFNHLVDTVRSQRGVLTPSELDNARFVINRDAVGSSDPATQTIGKVMRDALDNFTDTISHGDVHALPDAAGAVTPPEHVKLALDQARAANTRFRKVDSVNDALKSADLRVQRTYHGGNYDNSMRQAVSPFIDPQSPKQIFNLTPDEHAAIATVNRGAETSGGQKVHDAMRLAGRASPLAGGLVSGLNIGALTGAAAHPVLLAKTLGTMAVTSAAKLGADRWTGNNVAKLVQLMAAGGSKEAALAQRQLQSFAARNPTAAAVLKGLGQDLREYMGAASSAAGGQQQPQEAPAGP